MRAYAANYAHVTASADSVTTARNEGSFPFRWQARSSAYPEGEREGPNSPNPVPNASAPRAARRADERAYPYARHRTPTLSEEVARKLALPSGGKSDRRSQRDVSEARHGGDLAGGYRRF